MPNVEETLRSGFGDEDFVDGGFSMPLLLQLTVPGERWTGRAGRKHALRLRGAFEPSQSRTKALGEHDAVELGSSWTSARFCLDGLGLQPVCSDSRQNDARGPPRPVASYAEKWRDLPEEIRGCDSGEERSCLAATISLWTCRTLYSVQELLRWHRHRALKMCQRKSSPLHNQIITKPACALPHGQPLKVFLRPKLC